jgi:2,5-dihydroxypyridine 5,6-dioxygenase
MPGTASDESAVAVTAEFIVRDIMCLQPGEEVVITADPASDRTVTAAMFNASRTAGAQVSLLTIPRLPFQGALADPYLPQAAVVAVKHCDVWFDTTFPYISGSNAHAEAMKAKRARLLSLAGLDGGALVRLFGGVDYDKLFALQDALDAYLVSRTGAHFRVTSPSGTDVTFTTTKPATRKLRKVDQPGTYTPPGSAVLYPDPKSVRGVIVIEAAFHEYMTRLHEPIRIEVDGPIRSIAGGGIDRAVMERSLKRAASGRGYGSIIHFSHAFHPAARFTGSCFIEDIRVIGCNAIGFGTPWWEPGGGENHPDGVITGQSLWIDEIQIVKDGWLVAPAELVTLERALHEADTARPRPRVAPSAAAQ